LAHVLNGTNQEHQHKEEAASELAAFGSMNAGRAFDRDMLRGSTDDPLRQWLIPRLRWLSLSPHPATGHSEEKPYRR
jgi:hypothetical protein